MYRLDFTETACRVFDDRDRVVFTGSPRECENWLDCAENQAAEAPQPASSASHPNLLVRLRDWLVGPSTGTGGASCDIPDGRS